MFSEAERCFLEDVREKKKAANGVHSKTGKNGYTGKILFPTDIMSRKDKYNHRKAGKVMLSNIFDEILTLDEFNDLETHEKKNRMQYWRNNYTIKEIQIEMGISNKTFYQLIDELELPKDRSTRKPRKPRTASTKVKTVAITSQSSLEFAPEKELVLSTPPPPTPVQEIIVDGLHVVFNGTYTAEKIEKQLTKFMLLLDGEEEEFYVELKLMQKQQPN
jgi:hypothetical protein